MHLHCFSTSCYRYIGLPIFTFLITHFRFRKTLGVTCPLQVPGTGPFRGAQPSLLLCFANQGSLFMKWIIDVMRIARIPELIYLCSLE